MRKLVLIVLLLLTALPLWATHQRAAEITYQWQGGNTYEFTLTCYTYTPSLAGVQRDSLLMQWGDGFAEYVPRVVYQNLGDDYTLNVYRALHTFSSSGTYVVSMEDPDRNYGVVNVPNSVGVPMYIETELVISPYLGFNSSVQLLNAPVDKGCVGKPFYHNPSAYDPDGDSLSYRLVPCKGTNGEDIPGYSYPQASSLFDIDPVTGVLQWENPVLQGEYNVAIKVEEWRNGVLIGAVTRDMQILITACNNNVPIIECITDTCVVAGDSLVFTASAYDPDGNSLALTASGAPFELTSHPAVMSPMMAEGIHPSADFLWNTQCHHIRKTPYQVVIHAKDHASPVPLTNVHTVNISVVGPPVEDLDAELGPNVVDLTWSSYACANAEALRVYRKIGASGFTLDACTTGVPADFQLIAELPGTEATSYRDTNEGNDFEQGMSYCYRVVAVFHGDNESLSSDEVCVTTKNDRPLMTHVSNDENDLTAQRVMVHWTKPREIETFYTEPYSYRLIRRLDGVETTVKEGPDTVFVDSGVDLAQVGSLSYQVEMKDANQLVMGTSKTASAIKLSGVSGDRKAMLSWTESVPWMIDSTQVYREGPRGFSKIAVVSTMAFTDLEVENEKEYLYYVKTFGHYALEGMERPLVNCSAMVSVIPTDDEPPAPVHLEVDPDCELTENELHWHGLLEDDLVGFRIYHTSASSSSFALVATILNPLDTAYRHIGLSSVVGCYYMVAFDAKGNVSLPSDTVCIDYDACPLYELPNVFTPNSDGHNDVFTPIHLTPSLIDHVEMHIFNRWGRTVFDTKDPYINWDGRASGSHLPCADGTYFYVCDIYVKTPEGLVSQRLQGSIMIIRN